MFETNSKSRRVQNINGLEHLKSHAGFVAFSILLEANIESAVKGYLNLS